MVDISLIITGHVGIEKYTLRTNTWSTIGTMTGRRLQFGVAVLDGKLHVVGGRDGLKTLNTVESYDPGTNTWSQLPPMSTHRHGLGTVLHRSVLNMHDCAAVSLSVG